MLIVFKKMYLTLTGTTTLSGAISIDNGVFHTSLRSRIGASLQNTVSYTEHPLWERILSSVSGAKCCLRATTTKTTDHS